MTPFERIRTALREEPKSWVVTGVAGFIGSHLLEHLLQLGQRVIGLDTFVTGRHANLAEALATVDRKVAAGFQFVEGDIRELDICRRVCRDSDYVLHQAALGSVPRSLEDPVATDGVNVGGFLNMLVAARDSGIRRFVYAGSSAAYGDHPGLPKREDASGRPLSPYAATKQANELYAEVFSRCYGLESIGLRYFNVFGRRQDPEGPYAAVIPRWIGALIAGETCFINGDGETSRDFSPVENVVQANLLAALATLPAPEGSHRVYNVACGQRTTLTELFRLIRDLVARHMPEAAPAQPVYRGFRPGDIRHSVADIERIRQELGYEPIKSLRQGLEETVRWHIARVSSEKQARDALGLSQ